MGGARVHRTTGAEGALAALGSACAVLIEGCLTADECARWVRGVYEARSAWTHDFGGEQFTLGRAFYTHFEEGRSGDYFADPAASDALVEAHAPGLQQRMLDLVGAILGGGTRVVRRRGWCGPGVHVFPPGGPVAARGGVLHFDTEGLTAHHLRARAPAITAVAMLQASATAGGLRVWDVRYQGHDHPTAAERESPSAIVPYRAGDVVLIDSYRLHQIQPFDGELDRISATAHAARVDASQWECWF